LCKFEDKVEKKVLSPKIIDEIKTKKKGERAMEIKVSVTEFKELCKSIQRRPEEIFKMMREEIQKTIISCSCRG